MAILTDNPNFTNGGGVDAETMNDIAETAINANNVATKVGSSPDSTNAGLVGTPNVSIDTATGHLVFTYLKGETGATGNAISKVEKTSTSDLVDTYTITFTDGTTTTYTVTNGSKGDTGTNTVIKTYSEYQAGLTYKHTSTEMDIVYYGGSSYAPKNGQTISNIVPTNSTYWDIIALKGADGGGNVAGANNNAIELDKIYAFTPTNIPSTASGAVTGIWTLVNVPDLSVYLKITPATTTANAFLTTNENGALLNFITITDLFTNNGTNYIANRATSDASGNIISTYYATASALTVLKNSIVDGTTVAGKAVADSAGFNIRDSSVANMLHLGAYDTYTYDGTTGKYTVTRKTTYNNDGTQSESSSKNIETLSDRYFARTGQPYIEEWKKSEADRSSNLLGIDKLTVNDFVNCTASFSNGILTINPSTADPYVVFKTFSLKAGTYTISAYSTSAMQIIVFNQTANVYTSSALDTIGLNILTFTLQTDATIYIRIDGKQDGSVASQTVYNFIMTSGSVALPYQPYEGKVVHENELPTWEDISSEVTLFDNLAKLAGYLHYQKIDSTYCLVTFSFNLVGLAHTSGEFTGLVDTLPRGIKPLSPHYPIICNIQTGTQTYKNGCALFYSNTGRIYATGDFTATASNTYLISATFIGTYTS